jgi:MOSC domain-containing protein YiiM
MKILAVSVGGPREVEWQGRIVRTSIFKERVRDRVRIRRLNIDGDAQSDLSVHGGAEKAVYAYPGEHYAWWRGAHPELDFSWGGFGENLTTGGLIETDVRIGDRYRVGSAELVVTQPRMPCYKLGIRFGRPEMVKHFLDSRRSGFYFSVAGEGDVAPDDPVERLERDGRGLTVADVVAMYVADDADRGLLRLATEHPVLPSGWRAYFQKRLGE